MVSDRMCRAIVNLYMIANTPGLPVPTRQYLRHACNILDEYNQTATIRHAYCTCGGHICGFAEMPQCVIHNCSIRAKTVLREIFNGTGIYPGEIRAMIDATTYLLDDIANSMRPFIVLPGGCYIAPK